MPFTARLTRKYTTHALLAAIRKFVVAGGACRIVEIGGANSCFMDSFLRQLQPRFYHVIDNNQYGLDLLRQRIPAGRNVTACKMDVFDLTARAAPKADLVFSVGLVEHFDPEGTRKAIEAHFALLPPGGCAIITYPTPTWLYRAARSVCEALGAWKFPDERPLSRDEVLATVRRHGEVLFERILWPLVFTQGMVVARKPNVNQ